ncbi:hypothetical protein FACS1894111_11760 [Clostridia bacterium]|nr:hypothetical protein FACS1894111_11760 [Clostridia bacterium]
MHNPISKKKKRILLFLLIFLFLGISAVLLTFLSIRSKGDAALARIQEMQTIPDLQLPETEDFSDAQEGLQEGQVRYHGDVYTYNKDILTFLVLGIDKDEPVALAKDGISGGQSDGIFLVSLNPHTKTIKLLALNRNTMALVDTYDKDGNFLKTRPMQITVQHGFGDGMDISCRRSTMAVSRLLYQLPIAAYFSVNRGAISAVNDAVGGVTVEVLNDIYYPENGMVFQKGEMRHLRGREAFFYTATRNIHNFGSADLRLQRQRQYLSAFVSRFKQKAKINPFLPIRLYDRISDYSVTDLGKSELVSLFSTALGYTLDPKIYTPEGETVKGVHDLEEFHVDQEALCRLMLELFYEK